MDSSDAKPGQLSPASPASPASPSTRPARPNVFRHRHFLVVWVGAFGSSIGGWMEFVGMSWIINTTTHDPAKWLGWHAAAQLVPMMVFGIAGGVLTDRVNRKQLLLVTQGIMMVIALTITILTFMNAASLTWLMVLTVMLGCTMAFNVPAWQVLTPRLVPREELQDAIVLMGLQFNLARVIGPALGGVLMGYGGPSLLFAVNTVSFIGVIAAVATTPDSPAPIVTQRRSVWRETLEGLTFVVKGVGPRAAFLAMNIYGLLAAPLQRMMPLFISVVYYTRTMGKREQEFRYGVLLACMGIGAVLGVMVMRAMPTWYPKHHLIPVSILMSGIAITGFGATSNPVIAVPCLILAGAGWLMSFNSTFAAMQLLVPDELRGRVMAVCNTSVFGLMALGPVLAGQLADRVAPVLGVYTESSQAADSFGIRFTMAACGVVMSLAAIIMLTFRTPEVDGVVAHGENQRRPGLWRGLTASTHRPQGSGERPQGSA
jgi:MFS family permease